jgi:Ca2+-binding RTX toxin-like protein
LSGTDGVGEGDLDVTRRMRLIGVGETGAFLDASGLGDRVLEVSAGLRLRHLTLLGGASAPLGGIVRVDGGATRMTFVTLVGGRATDGGGVAVGDGAALRIDRSWVSAGRATERGGALFVRGTATVVRSTISGSRAGAGGGAWIGAAGCGLNGSGDRFVRDVRIGSLRQNGGPTPTHALRGDSPAIGNGEGCDDVDQRGAPRRDCDSGAYELVSCLGRAVTIVGTPGPDDLSGGLQPDVFLGRGGDDHFQGSLDRDRACGGPGNDVLIGGPHPHRLAGNRGNDRLLGEGGDDVLIGGPGIDVCRGGLGADIDRRCER